MMILRRACERRHVLGEGQEAWQTFYPEILADLLAGGFGALERFNEGRLGPGASTPRVGHDGAEVVTYVREGALSLEDSTGRTDVIQAGEFQRMTSGRGIHHSETNASRTEGAHVFQIWLRASEAGPEPRLEQKRFSAADRRGALRVVASPDGRSGSLSVHQDALMYSALLDSGRHIVHELSPGRSAWLHVVQGEVTVGDVFLSSGDGARVTGERAVSLTAQEESEILLLDVADRRRPSTIGDA